ncbi:uncharacterized protein LOC110612358 [Manihot esculenta]|uniref:Hydroxyproline-rich glycoprotein family protein n=1 Tax=Manihot esculenta TaxID=3983 RepID=A0A2C9W6A6_MANES|nr:uncharacterized protein LOC110612358 [Manihot esculenta]OAY54196.1 hypothetical protein MANES_03G055700v8 [Manihot esculenta]
MRGRSLSKQETREGKLKEEPHLSGAYIRCLVKQLTSSRTKDPMNPKDRGCVGDTGFSCQNMTKSGEETQQPQQHKKQVRRRLHTTKPYQQRLLNMAEARREIVAALKFHRASMKQAKEQQQQQDHRQQPSPPVQLSAQPCLEQEGKIKSRRNPRIYPSNTANFSNYLDTLSCTSNFSHAPPPSYPFCWSTSPNLPSTFIDEHLNFPLPNQTLGLNLNFQDFNDLDTTLYQSSNNPSLVYSSSSPSSFSSPSPSLSIITQEIPSVGKSQEGLPPAVSDSTETYGGGGLHQVMDDEEMAEIRSIGEQHQMEWNDTMNWVTSAWWFKFLKTMEPNQEVKTEDDNYHPFDQVIEFPAWLDSNDECLQQQFDDYCIQDY